MKSKKKGKKKATGTKHFSWIQKGSRKGKKKDDDDEKDGDLNLEDYAVEEIENIPGSSMRGIYRDKKYIPPSLQDQCQFVGYAFMFIAATCVFVWSILRMQ